MVESKFDKLANKIAKEYRKDGDSAEKAKEIGEATAAKIGFAKYGKRGMERKARAGRDAESFSAECVCGITCVCDCGCAESGVCDCGPSCPCPCGCGVEIETHDTESFEAPPSSRESKVARAMKTRSSGKSRGKKKGPFVFPARKAYPIGDMSHAKRALIFSTWPDNTQDAEKVRDAVFKRYPKLRDWFLDGKYAKHAESFEAQEYFRCKNCDYNVELGVERVYEDGFCAPCLLQHLGWEKDNIGVNERYIKDGVYAKELDFNAESFEAEVCPCGCAMVGCVCSSSCKGECLGAESFEAEWDFGDDRKSLRKGDEHSDFNNAWRWIFKTHRREWPKWGQKFYDKYEWTLDDPHWNPQMNTDREDLRLLITEFNDGPMGSADDFAWRRHLKTYEDLLAEVKELRAWKKLVSDIVKQQDGPHLREMLKELLDAESFEAQTCCGEDLGEVTICVKCEAMGPMESCECSGGVLTQLACYNCGKLYEQLDAESFEAEKIEGQTQSNIYAKFFVGHVSNDELRGNGKFKTYDSAVKKAKEVAKKEGNSRVVSPMGAALWTSNDKGLFQAGHLTKEAKRFYNSEEEMAVGYLSAESALYEAPMSVYDEYCIRQGPFCVMDRMPGKTLCVKCDEEFGEMFPHEAEYTALGVPTRRISASEIMSPTMQVLRNMFLIGGALFLITAVSASPPKDELLPTGNIEDVKMED